MASEPIPAFYENLRAVLGDAGSNGVYQWKDEQCLGAIRTTVQLGLGPKGVAVSVDGLTLNPAPASPDARGYLIYQAALGLIGGRQNVSFKTRAMQVNLRPEEREMTLEHFRLTIRQLEEKGDPHGTGTPSFFGVWVDLEQYIERTGELQRVV